jgi:HPt (histidine-containing phosphotransfer) domain-containing protein
MGADYKEVLGRLGNDERIQKFVLKVQNEKSYQLLCDSMEKRDMGTAFRAAHTLKGICLNLSLTTLYRSSDALTELLRDRKQYGEDIEPAFQKVKEDYERTITSIQKLAEDAK